MWPGFFRPSSVTVNSLGEVVVGVGDVDVVIFNKQGKRLRGFNNKLGRCNSVAFDGKDIFCIYANSNKIMRCTRYGGRVKVHQVKQVQGSRHHSVAVVGDEVMVCESSNEGTIMVYDKADCWQRCGEILWLVS